jgi:hypothetical protein
VRTREKRFPYQSGVVRVTVAKLSVTVSVCVAVIGHTNVEKVWTPSVRTPDCRVLLFGLQRKSPRREVVRILQREKVWIPTPPE